MSSLEEIREGLYAKQPGSPERSSESTLPGGKPFDSAQDKPVEVKANWEEESSAAPRLIDRLYLSRLRTERFSLRILVTVGLLGVIAIAALIGYLIFFARTDVAVEVLGPDKLTTGEPTVITLRVMNRSSVTLEEGTVTLNFPPGAIFPGEHDASLGPFRERIPVDAVPPGGEFRREVRVQFLGQTGDVMSISALYLYRPETIRSKLTRQAEYSAPIVKVPVAITIDVPEKISAGQEFVISVGVDAETSSPLPDMSLGIDFPAGFELETSEPAPPMGMANVWPIGNIESGTSTKITLRGLVRGDPEEARPFRIRLGRYDAGAKSWLLLTETTQGPRIASPFLLAQTMLDGDRRGAIVPGARIEGSVFYRNNLPQRIENLSVSVSFPESFVELGTVDIEDGFYDVTRRVLTWDPASAPELRDLDPGEEGTLTFSLALKADLPLRAFSDRNFRFPVTTIIDTGTPPPDFRGVSLAYQDRIEFQIASRLTLRARSAYYDSPAVNTGPLPPKVRKTTTYTIFLQLGSGSNDIRDVAVRGALAGGVEFKGTLGTDVGSAEFNPATREVLWRITQLPAATGTLRPHVSAIIQVALTPAENQADNTVPLFTSISALGRDVFTGAELSVTADDVSIELRTDIRSNSAEWRVVP